jgi:membrane complex biogenesis BtpA family protein
MKSYFGVAKPIIGMAHFGPLPGDPRYNPEEGIDCLAEKLAADITALQSGGIDGIMFSNESSQPWMTKTEAVTAISMASILGRLRREINIPFGVHVIWDPRATIDLAVAVGADFAWEIYTGVYGSDFGLWNTNAGSVLRHRKRISGRQVRLLFEIIPEAAASLDNRLFQSRVQSTAFNAQPDAFSIAGLNPGAPAPAGLVSAAKAAAPEIPVIISTGVNLANLETQLAVADGAIVGSALKQNGNLWNPVDPQRVTDFMQKVKSIR